MNLWLEWLELPVAARLVLLGLLGLVIGGQINWGIYRLAWHQRTISPWGPAPVGAPRRGWLDRLPVLGWFRLRRETPQHGRGFWIRPLLVEVGTAAMLAVLYWWEVDQLELIPRLPGIPFGTPQLIETVHIQYLAHAVLFVLMTMATFIDFDEEKIPDEITILGTLVALVLASILPQMHLPTGVQTSPWSFRLEPLLLAALWPAWLSEWPGLFIICLLYGVWCLSLLNNVISQHNRIFRLFKKVSLRKGVVYIVVSTYRRRSWIIVTPIFVFGILLLVGVWNIGGLRWQSLSSAVAGMAMGGAMIWGVRVVGGWALGIEAMGFGDVTLLAMIGAFLGWQAAVLVFFLAPAVAFCFAVGQLLTSGRHYIPFGPYLCVAALALIFFWNDLWTGWAEPVFTISGWVVPVTLAISLIPIGLMLRGYRAFRERVLGLSYRDIK